METMQSRKAHGDAGEMNKARGVLSMQSQNYMKEHRLQANKGEACSLDMTPRSAWTRDSSISFCLAMCGLLLVG